MYDTSSVNRRGLKSLQPLVMYQLMVWVGGLDSTKPLGIMFFWGLMDSANGKLVVWDPVVLDSCDPLMKGIAT